MKSNIPITKYKIWLAIFLISLLRIGNISSQEISPSQDSLSVDLPIVLSEIPSEFTHLSNYLVEISAVIEPEEKIVNNDSIISSYSVALEASKQEIETALPTMTYQRLESLVRAWYNYKNKFNIIQVTLKDRIIEIEIVKNELEEEFQKWGAISEIIEQNDMSEEFKQNSDTAVFLLNSLITKTNEWSDSLLLMQSKQVQLNLIIDEVIRILEEEQKIYQSNYFILDSKPIWNASDSIAQSRDTKLHFKTELRERYQNLKIYLRSNNVIVIFQLVFIILLIIGFLLMNRIWPTGKLDIDSTREIQAGFVIRHPFFASLLIGIIISLFFYTNRPPALGSFFVMLLMFSSLVLLPGLLTKKIKIPLLLLFALFIINFIQEFLPYQSFVNRMIIILQSLTAILLIIFAYRIKSEFELKPKRERFLTGFIWIFGILMIFAFIANIIGAVKLSDFLISSTIGTLTFSVITVTIVIILNSLMILLIKGKKAQSIPLYEQLKKLIDKRIRPLINWGGLMLWVFAALIYFRLLKPVQDLIDNIMDFEFMISTVAISIGGVISFFLIVFFTYIFARFVKSIFKDEWVTKSNLPRGTADSVSMLIRYTIVAFGIYLALGALGVSLNRFGFMAGALGVGIGFGLQNVVLNFIAGLILTFERPFHVGDVIEVDQYMGTVTEIGVRASKVLTWDGSEVIVPNGALITNKVVNWTLTNQKRRLKISIKTPFDANPEKVIEIITVVAKEHPNTFDNPAPFVLFNGYESSSLDFTVYCWVYFDNSLGTKSDIAISAKKTLLAAGIEAPLPVQKIKIDDNLEKNAK